MKLPIVRCAAKPSTSAEHGARGEDAARDRPHLRDHEQRRHDADEDDRREDRAAQDAVARRRRGVEMPAADACVDDLGERSRERDHPRRQGDARPEVAHQSILRRPAKPSSRTVPPLDCSLADPPAEQHLLAFAERGEVEQTAVGVLELDADRRQLVDDLLELARELRELGVRASPTPSPLPLPAMIRTTSRCSSSSRPAGRAARPSALQAG